MFPRDKGDRLAGEGLMNLAESGDDVTILSCLQNCYFGPRDRLCLKGNCDSSKITLRLTLPFPEEWLQPLQHH